MDVRQAWKVFERQVRMAAIIVEVGPLPIEPMSEADAIEFGFTPEEVEEYDREQMGRDLDEERRSALAIWDAWVFLFEAAGARLPSPERVTEGDGPEWKEDQ